MKNTTTMLEDLQAVLDRLHEARVGMELGIVARDPGALDDAQDGITAIETLIGRRRSNNHEKETQTMARKSKLAVAPVQWNAEGVKGATKADALLNLVKSIYLSSVPSGSPAKTVRLLFRLVCDIYPRPKVTSPEGAVHLVSAAELTAACKAVLDVQFVAPAERA